MGALSISDGLFHFSSAQMRVTGGSFAAAASGKYKK